MKTVGLLLILIAVAAWAAFTAILLGVYSPGWLPKSFTGLQLPKSAADLGQALGVVDGLISSIALVLGLLAIFFQTRQQADSNIIGGLSARLQFLQSECDRLESDIQRLKSHPPYDKTLLDNMASKKSRMLDDARRIDERLRQLLGRI